MKQEFKAIRLGAAKLAIIDQANELLEQYRNLDIHRVTLRQLYYRFIALDLFPQDWIDPEYNAKQGLPADTKNTVKNYKRLGDVLNDARLAGHLDWSAIEDRGRVPDIPAEWNDLEELVEAAVSGYRLPRWQDQDVYAELWVEKQALAGILEPLAREHHVPLMVNKGYSSQSAMYESAQRFIDRGDGRAKVLFYLGDFDPSGEDMVRDVRERLEMFGVEDLDVMKVGLTWEQIQKLRPPPNPAKVTDSRAAKYIEKYGRFSWEVDAIPPDELERIIHHSFSVIIDRDRLNVWLAQEKKDKAELLKATKAIMKRRNKE